MKAPAFKQIAVTAQIGMSVVLYGLDGKGRIWRKVGSDPWKRVPAEAEVERAR